MRILDPGEFAFTVNVCRAGTVHCLEDGIQHIKTLPFLSIVQAISGRYEISLDHERLPDISAGACFIAPAGVLQDIIHRLPDNGDPMKARYVFLDVRVNGTIPFEQFIRFPRFLTPEQAAPVGKIIDELLELQMSGDLQRQDSALSEQGLGTFPLTLHLHRIALSLAEHICGLSRQETPDLRSVKAWDRILLAIQAIEKEPSCSVSMLAKISSLSVPRFHAVFKEATGISPKAYILDRQLRKAAGLLITTNMPLSEVAAQCGFSDQFHFSKRFKFKFGQSPRKYRQSHQKML